MPDTADTLRTPVTVPRVPSARSIELLELARRIVDALPHDVVQEAAVTGSVSRGVADDLSDIEMLLVTSGELSLGECFELARAAGLEQLSTWGPQNVPTRRVFGYFHGVPIELVWWSGGHAETAFAGSGDAIVHAVPLRTAGRLGRWQAELETVPVETICEEAALPWGGFAPEGILTIARPRETLSRLEWTVDGANRVLRIVYAVNGLWAPTAKRLAERSAELLVKPERLAERIEDALTEPDPRRALRVLTEVQLDAVQLAPEGPNVLRARDWLERALDLL
jgi:predicted nucleotidyltransferase